MLDLGLAFVHYDASTKRIDVDGENHVLHLKVSTHTCTLAKLEPRRCGVGWVGMSRACKLVEQGKERMGTP